MGEAQSQRYSPDSRQPLFYQKDGGWERPDGQRTMLHPGEGTLLSEDPNPRHQQMRRDAVSRITRLGEKEGKEHNLVAAAGNMLYESGVPYAHITKMADTGLDMQRWRTGDNEGTYHARENVDSVYGLSHTISFWNTPDPDTVVHEFGHAMHLHDGEPSHMYSYRGVSPIEEGVADGYADRYTYSEVYHKAPRKTRSPIVNGSWGSSYPAFFKLPTSSEEPIRSFGQMYAAHRYRTRAEGVPHHSVLNTEMEWKDSPHISGPQFAGMRAIIDDEVAQRQANQGEQLRLF